ncbi:MAG: PorT family protein [Muribaculaceae bacterium]|nr:PorT family protein [Muribaculaceae bacterium]
MTIFLRQLFLKKIIILLCVFTFCLGMNAQTHYQSNVAIGIKGGMDFSEVFFNPHVKQTFVPGYTAGIAVRYIEENHFGLIGELNFAQRGWKENFEAAPYEYSRSLDFLDLCFLAHVFFGRRGRFFFNAGPQVGYYLGEHVKSNFNPFEMNKLPDFPLINRINQQMVEPIKIKIDYGISAGIGGEFNINRRNSLCVECRFYFGLANIFSTKRADYFNASNQMSLSATIGYWFRVK